MVKTKTSRIDKKAKETPGTLICTGYFYMFHSVLSCVILTALSNRDPATGGGEHMEIVISFLPTGIIAYADHEINMLRLCKSVIFPPFVTKSYFQSIPHIQKCFKINTSQASQYKYIAFFFITQ